MALPPGFVLEQPKVNLPPGFVLETTPEAPPEKQSFMRQVADVPLGVAKGAVQGIRMIADAFGAGSETSNTIKGAEEYLAGLMSAEAKKDQAEIARIMKDAEDKGVLDQVKAGLQAFATAPVDTLSQALGTAAPVIVGTLGAKILGAGALVSTGLGVATGAGMGAGVVKGSIYEETKKALIEAGADPKVAEQKAQQAQEYGGKNLDQILLGTVLGGVAAAGPLEKGGAAILARRILGKAGVEEAGEATAEAAAKGALRRRAEAGALEAVPEAVQAGQEQLAQNIALQREGFDVPTMRGVAGAATLEGLAGAGLGATVGGGKPEARPPEAPPPEPTAEVPPPVEQPPTETPEPPTEKAPPVEEPPIAPPPPVAEAPTAAPPVEEGAPVEPPVAEAPPVTPPVEEPPSVEAAPPAEVTSEPPVPSGFVRVYHSGSKGEGESGRWVSTQRSYAENYRPDLPLFYTDIPENDPRVNNADYPEQGVKQGFTFNFELTPQEATNLKEISRQPAEKVAPEVEVTEKETTEQPVALPRSLKEFRERLPQVFDRAEVRAANESGNFRQLAQALMTSQNPVNRRIGQLAQPIASKVTLEKPGRLQRSTWSGQYSPSLNAIKMNPAHAGNEEVNAHETVHALIANAQASPTEKQKPYVEKINELYKHVKKELKKKGITAYGLKDEYEFTAEAMSNPKFQYELMQIPYKGRKNAWSEFVKLVADLLGIQNTNALTEVMTLVEKLAETKGAKKTKVRGQVMGVEKAEEPSKPSLKERIIEAGREAGQKRKLDTGAFEGVDAELVKSLEPTFAPRNVTVQDRILGMRDNFWQRMAQGIADQYRTIKEYSEEAYMKARLSKTVDGGLEGLMFYGQVFNDGGALNIKKNTRGMMDILKPVGKELDRYFVWVALNRDATLPEENRSIDPKIVARREEFADGTLNGKSRKEIYEQVRRDMNTLNRSVLKVALDAGLLNTTEGAIKDIEANEKLTAEEKREKIAELRKNPIGYERFINDLNYIPFYRVMEGGDTDSVAKVVSATGLTNQIFSKALKGGEKPFGDLMENVLRNWNHILSAAMKNQAAVATVEAAVKAGAAKPNLKPGLEMRDGKVYSIMSDEIVGDGSVRPELTEAGKGTVKVVVDGKNAHYEVTDPLLLDSITSIGYLGPQSKFLDVARDFKNILQFGVTISPQFKVNNLIRDSVSAMGVSELRKNPIANVLEGVSLSDRNSPTYIAAMAGGAIFNFGTAYEGDQSRLIKRLLKMGVDRDHILDSKDKITAGLRYAWDKYQEWGNKSEAANRLALYQQLHDKKMSHLEATFRARDLLDFSMQGSWPAFRILTQVIPFLNARVQGLYKLGRDGIIPTARVINNTLTGKPTDATDRQKAQQFLIVSIAVMSASALLYLLFKDDEEYKRRDEWDKDNFWWFRLPGMDFALRIPKPFEIGALGTLVERTLEQIYDSGAEGKQFTDAVKRTFGSTFALNPIPQMFKPLVDIYANKDAFTGAPIESAGLERLSKQERMINTTSPLAIALGKVSTLFPEAMELSPVQADYLIKGYFGWLGATAATTSMYATMPFNEGEYPDARWMDRLSLGLARELPGRGAKYVTAFYESNKEISQAFADMRHYAEMGDSEKVQKILEEKGDKIQLAKFYDKTAKTMANIRKQVRVVQNDKDMDGAAKKEEIDRLNDLISTLAKQAEEVRKSMKQN